MSTNFSARLLTIVLTTLFVLTILNTPIADPVVQGVPPVFCFRVTHIVAGKSDSEGTVSFSCLRF